MRTFSKIAFICNICFIVSAIMRVVELTQRAKGNNNAVIPLPAVESTIVVLGVVAIFVNVVFLITFLFMKLAKKPLFLSKFLLRFNLFLLPVQIWYFFYSLIIR
jgi:hypothetical protein